MQLRYPLSQLTERYAFLDPAGTKQGSSTKARIHRARTAISVVAVDDLERVYWLYCWAKVVANVDEILDQVYQVQNRFNPLVFGCEANAMQALFAEMLEREALRDKQHLPLAAITQPTNIDKDFRDRCILHPVINEGRLLVSPEIPDDCVKELTGFPLTTRRDVVDTLASSITLIPPRRGETAATEQRIMAAYEAESRLLYTGPALIQDEERPGEEEYSSGGFDPFAEFRGFTPAR